MSIWELFNLRQQNAAQQIELRSAQSVAHTHRMTASSWQAVALQTQQTLDESTQRNRRMSAELDDTLDELLALQVKHAALTREHADVVAANSKLVREGLALREVADEYLVWLEARSGFLHSLREHMGDAAFDRAVAGSTGLSPKETRQKLREDPAHRTLRARRLADEIAFRLEALDRLPHGGASEEDHSASVSEAHPSAE